MFMKSVTWLMVLFIVSNCAYAAKEEITLAKISMFKDKIELMVPSSFKVMPEFEMKDFYPEKDLPKVVYMSEDKTIRLAFNVRDVAVDQSKLPAFKEKFMKEWKTFDPKLKEIANEITTVDGRDMGCIAALHKKTPEKFYRFIFFTDYEGMLLSGSLVCPKKGYKQWVDIGYKIMNSVDIK
jgi:hypothetical protein